MGIPDTDSLPTRTSTLLFSEFSVSSLVGYPTLSDRTQMISVVWIYLFLWPIDIMLLITLPQHLQRGLSAPKLSHQGVLQLVVVVVWSLSHINSFATPWTIAHQAPLSIGFPRQEYWGGLPFPSSGNLPDPGIEPSSPAFTGRFFTAEPPGKPIP